MASVFGARLDLLVRLVDTTTGAAVNERNVLFYRNDQQIRPESRGDGNYVFINTGRESFLMRVEVFGYERYRVFVDYGLLDEDMPSLDAFLMPSENVFRSHGLISFQGTLPFLKTIEAVNLSLPVCRLASFDPKTRRMEVFTEGDFANLSSRFYGLLDAGGTKYEKIEVRKIIAAKSVCLKEKITEEFTANSPIARIVFGTVSEQGEYLLRVSDDAEKLRYLVRYEVGDEVRFQTIDFRAMEELR